jgi:hypothetical protein
MVGEEHVAESQLTSSFFARIGLLQSLLTLHVRLTCDTVKYIQLAKETVLFPSYSVNALLSLIRRLAQSLFNVSAVVADDLWLPCINAMHLQLWYS